MSSGFYPSAFLQLCISIKNHCLIQSLELICLAMRDTYCTDRNPFRNAHIFENMVDILSRNAENFHWRQQKR